MSKITFRADDDLIDRIDAMEASKSEVMREALRAYFDERSSDADSLDDVLTDRIDRRIESRLGHGRSTIDLTVTVEDDHESPDHQPEDPDRSDSSRDQCPQCGEPVDPDHVYCPNCGEKAVNREFCDCGDEIRSDWAFCPSCGRRTPAADVLDR